MPNNTTNAVLNVNQGENLKVYADEFIEKAAPNIAGTRLSKEELDWGAKCIDDMIEQLYANDKDTLYKLKEKGIDPASGFLIDGKPADLYSMGDKLTSLLKEDTRPGKCKILANALNGKEIGFIKYGFDKDGNVKPQEAVPVTTNLSKDIKEKKTNFFIRFLEAIGLLTPKLNQRVNKANNSERNYEALYQETTPNQEEQEKFKNELAAVKEKVAQKELDNPTLKVPEKPQQMFSAAGRRAISAQLSGEVAKLNTLYNQMDLDFFGDQFETKQGKTKTESINAQIQNKFRLTTVKDYTDDLARDKSTITSKLSAGFNSLDTMTTSTRRTHLAILYAMTQGISFDEITKPENSALRKQMGEKFMNEMSTMSFQEYAEKNKIEKGLDDPETKKAYQEYFLNQTAKLEKFYCESYDAIRKESYEIPNPNDYNDIIQKYQKYAIMGAVTQDLTQSAKWLAHPDILFEDTPVNKDSKQRLNAVVDYVRANVGPLAASHTATSNYVAFLTSPDFSASGENHSLSTEQINRAARGKAAMQVFYDSTHDIDGKETVDCLARVFDNPELSEKIVSFRADNGIAFNDNKKIAEAAFNNYLRTNDPEMATVMYDENNKKLVFFSNDASENYNIDMTKAANTYTKDNADAQKQINKYFTYDTTMTFTDAYEDGVRAHPISETEKAAKEAYYADMHTKIDESFKKQAAEEAMKKEQEEKLAAERNRPLTEAEKAAQEKENYITGAMKDGISRENAELLWKTEQHDKKVAQEIDGVMKEADELQNTKTTETKTRMTRDEFMGTTNQKKTMPPKETQAHTKQMGMSKP